MADKPTLHLTGPTQGGLPDVEDLVALYRQLTGKDPSPAEIDELRRDMEDDADVP